jgi:hypothetical protein
MIYIHTSLSVIIRQIKSPLDFYEGDAKSMAGYGRIADFKCNRSIVNNGSVFVGWLYINLLSMNGRF